MRRTGLALLFLAVGLATTWVALKVGSQMSYRLPFKLVPRNRGGCYEIGPCWLPWWAIVLLLGYLLGPTLIFAITGCVSARPGTGALRVWLRLLALIIWTSLFFLVGYALQP